MPLLFVPTLLFVGSHFLAILSATDRWVALREAVKMAGIFGFFFAVGDTVGSTDRRRMLAWALTVSAAILSAMVLAEVFWGPAGWGYTGARPTGTMGSPNAVGAYLAALYPVSFTLLCQERLNSRRLRATVPLAISVGLMSGALLATLSRGAWISVVAALLTMALALTRKPWPRGLLSGSVIALGLTGLAAALILMAPASKGTSIVKTVVQRAASVTQLDSSSDRVRWMLLKYGWAMFLDNLWLGVGPGNFQARLPAYLMSVAPEEKSLVPFALALEFPHNLPIQVAAENGIIGLTGLAVWVGSLMADGIRRLRRLRRQGTVQTPSNDLLTVGGFAGVVATLVGALFGYPFVHHVWEPFVYTMALAISDTSVFGRVESWT